MNMEGPQQREVLNEREFQLLAEKHGQSLYGLAMKYTKGGSVNGHTADDLLQVTLEKAWVNRAKFTVGTSFIAWTTVILRTTFTHLYRRHTRIDYKTSSTHDDEGREMHTLMADNRALTDPEQVLPDINGEVRDALEDCLTDQQIFLLLSFELRDKTYKEMAEELGIPVGTVMSGLHRARKKVRHDVSLATYFGNEYL